MNVSRGNRTNKIKQAKGRKGNTQNKQVLKLAWRTTNENNGMATKETIMKRRKSTEDMGNTTKTVT